MLTSGFCSTGHDRSVEHEVLYHNEECRRFRARASPFKFPLVKISIRMNFKACQSMSRKVMLTLLLLALLLLDLSMVSCLPVTEFPSSPSQVTKHHIIRRHNLRHHTYRERTKHHHSKHFHRESIEVLDTSGSLSIVIPLDILRQNIILETQRKRLREATDKQVKYNTEFLERIG